MDVAPLDAGRRRQAVDGIPENVEHSRQNLFADRRLQFPAGVFHGVAAGEPFGWGQRDSPSGVGIELCQTSMAIFPSFACSSE